MLPIYVISLEKDLERRKAIKTKLDSLSIKFEFVDAIYGDNLPSETISQLRISGGILVRGFGPTNMEIGCTLSHLKVYQLMSDRRQDWACILEDDVILDNKILDFYSNFHINRYKFNCQNLYLLGGQEGIPDNRFISKSLFDFFYVGKEKFNKTIDSEKYIFRTCCYVLSTRLAEKIIDLSKSVFLLADDWNYMAKNKIIKDIYLASLARHPFDLSKSNIEKERQDARYSMSEKGDSQNSSKFIKFIKTLVLNLILCFKIIRTQLRRLRL